MNKNADFAKKRRDLVDKSPPSISRICSPQKGHPIIDYPELFLSGKITKNGQIDDFLIVFYHQLSQNVHVQFTFKDPHILQNRHQV